ncbi:hypothetical protein ACH49_29650 [Streptomyces leeuwenhoekii]|uniref:Uncharacterized protein n=1 Tax=Streptomyces leeuwenhoekii TaxID=1437453 RepID=A0ABR5HQI3_STRLW|nr:hypothetical protein ACH49_29650 [Streptomyces leeuwenhoekii]
MLSPGARESGGAAASGPGAGGSGHGTPGGRAAPGPQVGGRGGSSAGRRTVLAAPALGPAPAATVPPTS